MFSTHRPTSPFRSATAKAIFAVVLSISASAAASDRTSLRSDVAKAYLDVIETLASGDAEQALETHLADEVALAPTRSDEEIERLDAGQLAVARRLSSTSSESLVPLVTLHERAYLEHLAGGRLRLAVRSRRFAVDLTELYVAQSRRPDADRLGSALMTSLGGYLQQSTMDTAAGALYLRALDLDPLNATARLGLASLLERQGKYAEVVPHLETLLGQGDESPRSLEREARLRLGVNLLRLGRLEEGLAALELLLQDPERDWILSLAYQELAHQESAAGNVAGARDLLTEAAEKLPEDSSLAVQLAYLVDRAGGRPRPADLRRRLETTVTSAGPSPRALYASPTGAALETLREDIEDNARRRLAPLEDALGGREGSR